MTKNELVQENYRLQQEIERLRAENLALTARNAGLIACAEHYAADESWDRLYLLEAATAALFYQAGVRTNGKGTRDGWTVAREALRKAGDENKS